MIRLLRLLFGNGKHKVGSLAQEEVHKTHNKYTSELLKIRHRANAIEKEARQIKEIVDTATQVAIVTSKK